MAIKHLFLFLLICTSQILNGQIGTKEKIRVHQFSTRIGLNTLNQVNFSYSLRLSDKIAGHMEIMYNPGWGQGGLRCNAVRREIADRKMGFGIKTGVSILEFGRLNGNRISFLLEIRNASIDSVSNDEGCFSGSSSSFFEAFSWKGNDLGVMVYFDRGGRDFGIIDTYIGLGFDIRQETRHYFRRGFYSSSQPIDETIIKNVLIPRFDIGIRINLCTFGNSGD